MKEKLTPATEIPLDSLESKIATKLEGNHKHIIVLSDLDETLTNHYTFDPGTNNHFPILSPEMLSAAGGHKRIIIATARLANDPVIPMIHEQLQMPSLIPIIAEDGGAIVCQDSLNRFIALSVPALLKSENFNQIPTTLDKIHNHLTNNPLHINNQNIFISKGLTILKVRAQNNQGQGNPETHTILADMLTKHVSNHLFEIQTTGSSVTVKPKGISKSQGLTAVFDKLTSHFPFVPWHDESFIIGLGDNQNDQSIFSRADLSICVGNKPLNADIFCPHGSRASLKVLQTVLK